MNAKEAWNNVASGYNHITLQLRREIDNLILSASHVGGISCFIDYSSYNDYVKSSIVFLLEKDGFNVTYSRNGITISWNMADD